MSNYDSFGVPNSKKVHRGFHFSYVPKKLLLLWQSKKLQDNDQHFLKTVNQQHYFLKESDNLGK